MVKQKFEVEAAVMEAETPKLITYVAALLYLLKFSGIQIPKDA